MPDRLVVVASATNERLATTLGPHEQQPQLLGRARRPDPRQIAAQLVDAKRRMAVVLVQEPQGLHQPPLILLSEVRECLEELARKVERCVGPGYRRPRARVEAPRG